ncbi:hypothetical protein DFH11DRAFT_1731047 [Phellopilus nigrolimitatus]|nr:hypothetical protein DFH11DRAFT_1731047 [Phellopilus nigrolimitatus]
MRLAATSTLFLSLSSLSFSLSTLSLIPATSARELRGNRIVRRPLAILDTCTYIDSDLTSILGLDDSIGTVADAPVQQCLCQASLPAFIRHDLVVRDAVGCLGYDAVYNAFISYINQAANSTQCVYPAHAIPECVQAAPCAFQCTDGFTLSANLTNCICPAPYTQCAGRCGSFPNGCPSLSTCSSPGLSQETNPRPLTKLNARPLSRLSGPAAAAASEAAQSQCTPGESVCGAPRGGYECIDTRTNPESCGGCALRNPPSPSSSSSNVPGTGMDCTALEGVASVACRAGRCAVLACRPGFKVASTGDACILEGAVTSFQSPANNGLAHHRPKDGAFVDTSGSRNRGANTFANTDTRHVPARTSFLHVSAMPKANGNNGNSPILKTATQTQTADAKETTTVALHFAHANSGVTPEPVAPNLSSSGSATGDIPDKGDVPASFQVPSRSGFRGNRILSDAASGGGGNDGLALPGFLTGVPITSGNEYPGSGPAPIDRFEGYAASISDIGTVLGEGASEHGTSLGRFGLGRFASTAANRVSASPSRFESGPVFTSTQHSEGAVPASRPLPGDANSGAPERSSTIMPGGASALDSVPAHAFEIPGKFSTDSDAIPLDRAHAVSGLDGTHPALSAGPTRFNPHRPPVSPKHRVGAAGDAADGSEDETGAGLSAPPVVTTFNPSTSSVYGVGDDDPSGPYDHQRRPSTHGLGVPVLEGVLDLNSMIGFDGFDEFPAMGSGFAHRLASSTSADNRVLPLDASASNFAAPSDSDVSHSNNGVPLDGNAGNTLSSDDDSGSDTNLNPGSGAGAATPVSSSALTRGRFNSNLFHNGDEGQNTVPQGTSEASRVRPINMPNDASHSSADDSDFPNTFGASPDTATIGKGAEDDALAAPNRAGLGNIDTTGLREGAVAGFRKYSNTKHVTHGFSRVAHGASAAANTIANGASRDDNLVNDGTSAPFPNRILPPLNRLHAVSVVGGGGGDANALPDLAGNDDYDDESNDIPSPLPNAHSATRGQKHEADTPAAPHQAEDDDGNTGLDSNDNVMASAPFPSPSAPSPTVGSTKAIGSLDNADIGSRMRFRASKATHAVIRASQGASAAADAVAGAEVSGRGRGGNHALSVPTSTTHAYREKHQPSSFHILTPPAIPSPTIMVHAL